MAVEGKMIKIVSFSIVCLLLLLMWGFLLKRSYSPDSINGKTIICSVCADGENVPTFPIMFSARFAKKTFATAGQGIVQNEVPPVQYGKYKYERKSSNESLIHLRQPEKNIESFLELSFTHSSGGIMKGVMLQNDHQIAKQVGFFAVC